MDSKQHKVRAEQLLREGEKCVGEMRNMADLRETYPAESNRITDRMDELGKKLISIWAQAQVHATLATINDGTTT